MGDFSDTPANPADYLPKPGPAGVYRRIRELEDEDTARKVFPEHHEHQWVRIPGGLVGPFRCEVIGCTALEHPAICRDDEGKLECCCGLEDLLERNPALRRDREPDVPTLTGDDAVRFVEAQGLGDLGALFQETGESW